MAYVSDNFNRANENPLASPWSDFGASAVDFKLVSNSVTPTSLISDDAQMSLTSITWPNDQYCQVKVTVTGTSAGAGGGLAVRCAAGAKTFYRVVVNKAASANVEVAKFVAGAFTSLGTRTTTWVDGDTLQMRIVGTSIYVYQNGIQLGALITDSALTSGNAGISYSSTVTTMTLDDFEGGDNFPPLLAAFQPSQQTVYRM